MYHMDKGWKTTHKSAKQGLTYGQAGVRYQHLLIRTAIGHRFGSSKLWKLLARSKRWNRVIATVKWCVVAAGYMWLTRKIHGWKHVRVKTLFQGIVKFEKCKVKNRNLRFAHWESTQAGGESRWTRQPQRVRRSSWQVFQEPGQLTVRYLGRYRVEVVSRGPLHLNTE